MLLWMSSRRDCGFEDLVDLADDVAFEAADDLAFVPPFDGAAGQGGAGGFVEPYARERDVVDRRVQLPVAAAVETVAPVGPARSGRDRQTPAIFAGPPPR